MNSAKLENFEAIMCLIMMTIANIVLISSRILIEDCSSASLLSCLFISIVLIAITFILCLLSKHFIGKDLLDVSEFLGGKVLKIIVGISFTLYFLFIMSIFLKRMADALQIIYYPLTNIIFIIASFCIACGIIASLGNNSLFKTMALIVPFLYWAIVLIFIGNGKNLNFQNIYPLFGNGFKSTILNGLSNLYSFAGFAYLFFLPSKLKNPEKIMKIGLISSIVSGTYLLFCLASILLLFGDVLVNSNLPPLYISVRYIEFGTFFQRLDAAFIFLCILGFICALNINLYFILDILKNAINISNNKMLIFPCLQVALGLSIIIKKDSILNFLDNSLFKFLFILFALLIPFFIFFLAGVKNKHIALKNK